MGGKRCANCCTVHDVPSSITPRNAARFRAKDMTSRIQKGFFRKQKLASLTKAQSGRASAASREAEPISLSHAVHRRDSRDEAPTISLHVKRTNSTSSRTVEKKETSRPKTGGRSEFLDALDTTERASCARGAR